MATWKFGKKVCPGNECISTCYFVVDKKRQGRIKMIEDGIMDKGGENLKNVINHYAVAFTNLDRWV